MFGSLQILTEPLFADNLRLSFSFAALGAKRTSKTIDFLRFWRIKHASLFVYPNNQFTSRESLPSTFSY